MKTAPIPMQPRQLVAAYRFNEKTFVWRCDQCAKMFFLEVEEALLEGIPRLTLREFDSHLCALHGGGAAPGRDEDFGKIVLFSQDERPREEGLERE